MAIPVYGEPCYGSNRVLSVEGFSTPEIAIFTPEVAIFAPEVAIFTPADSTCFCVSGQALPNYTIPYTRSTAARGLPPWGFSPRKLSASHITTP